MYVGLGKKRKRIEKVLLKRVWWHMPLILAFGRQRQFEVNLVYRVRFWTTKDTQRNHVWHSENLYLTIF